MKTIKEWFQELPDGYRELASKYLAEWHSNNKTISMSEAIKIGFAWEYTHEGCDFWKQVHDYYNQPILPQLPKTNQDNEK